MRVLVTGASGFIGKNLTTHLSETDGVEVLRYGRESTLDELRRGVVEADLVCHLAGVNRPDADSEFRRVNTDLTRTLCAFVQKAGKPIPILFASSVHADQGTPYGLSKLAAEETLLGHSKQTGNPVYIIRLPNVFGKWCRPNYNSVVATYCYNIARDLPIRIDDPEAVVRLAYIDDVVNTLAQLMTSTAESGPYCSIEPVYTTTIGELADQIRVFRSSRESLVSDRVGVGLVRALYATYVSYLPTEAFAYELTKHDDARGSFVEMLKTRDSGQISFFTAHPGVTRGGHYHHSKIEKFLVLTGRARFRFRHILSNEIHEILTTGGTPRVVEMAPGWTHDITNVGDDEMVVMLWASEVFNQECPDTVPCPI